MMVKAVSSPILQLIRRAVEDHRVRELPDQELVERFDTQQDQAAFHALLRRHGAMVLDVCRGVLGNDADAEDAFQATFLIFAQKAGSIRKRASLGSWLHGVAHRTALKARVQSATREKHEARVPVRQVSGPDDLSWREVWQVLHEELSGIPERYRAPLMLCYLEGASHETAATELNVAKSTLRERLERGRTLLRTRLIGRGLGPAALLLAAAWPAAHASASVPVSLVVSTVKAVAGIAAGKAAASVVSARVAAITEGVLKAMFLTKLKTGAVMLVILGFVIAGAGIPIASSLGVDQSATTRDVPAKRQAKIATALAVNQPEKQEQPQPPPTWKVGPTLHGHGDRVWEVAFSPDGKQIASSSSDKTVVVWDVAKRESVHTLSHAGTIQSIAFAPNGKTLVTASGYENEEYLIQFWDPETGKEQAVLKGHTNPVHRLSFSRDGKILVSANGSLNSTGTPDKGEVYFWDVATKKKIATLEAGRGVHTALLSDDSKRVVTAHGDGTVRLWELDEKFAAKRETVLEQNVVCGLRASPDGKTFVIIPVSHGKPSVINLWDFETGQIVKSFEHKDVYTVWDVAFAADGKTLATGCRKTIKKGDDFELGGAVKFWDVATGKEQQALENIGPINGLAFAPDGKTLAIGLYHKENVKLKGEEGGFVQPADGYSGVVVLCELKKGKP